MQNYTLKDFPTVMQIHNDIVLLHGSDTDFAFLKCNVNINEPNLLFYKSQILKKKYIKPAFLAQCSEQEHTSTDSNVGNFIMDDVKVHLVCGTKEATDYTVA